MASHCGEPGAKRHRASVKGSRRSPQLQEDLLEQVLRQRLVPHDAEDDAVYGPRIKIVDSRKSFLIAPLEAGNQAPVVAPFNFGYLVSGLNHELTCFS